MLYYISDDRPRSQAREGQPRMLALNILYNYNDNIFVNFAHGGEYPLGRSQKIAGC